MMPQRRQQPQLKMSATATTKDVAITTTKDVHQRESSAAEAEGILNTAIAEAEGIPNAAVGEDIPQRLPSSPHGQFCCLGAVIHPWTPPRLYQSPKPSLLFAVPLPRSRSSLKEKAMIEDHYADFPNNPQQILLEQEQWERKLVGDLLDSFIMEMEDQYYNEKTNEYGAVHEMDF